MGLYNPGLDEAREFVFRNYVKRYNPWLLKAHLGVKKPNLSPVLKSVTKKFNSFGNPEAQFTVDMLTKYYIADRLEGFEAPGGTAPATVQRQYRLEAYGLETLGGKVGRILKRWVATGDTEKALTAL